MSRNRDLIEAALREAKIQFHAVEWHPIRRGPEMCGPEGGWVLVDKYGQTVDWLGYNTTFALGEICERVERRISSERRTLDQ